MNWPNNRDLLKHQKGPNTKSKMSYRMDMCVSNIYVSDCLHVDTIKSKHNNKDITITGTSIHSGPVIFEDTAEFQGGVIGMEAIKHIDCCDICKEDRESGDGTFGFEWDEEMDLTLSQSSDNLPNEEADKE